MPNPSGEELRAALETLLSREIGEDARVDDLAIVAGGASRETWRFDLGVGGVATNREPLILRRQLGGKIYDEALDVADEYDVIQAVFAAGILCPRPRWFLADVLSRPAMVLGRLNGESIGRRVVRDAALAAARASLPEALGATLAKIHQVSLDDERLRSRLFPRGPSSTPARRVIDQLERDLDVIAEPHPGLELVLRWLRLNEPKPPDRLVFVHGDFRIGNVLVSPTGLQGIIDWEFAHVGEPAEDLAWGLVREWRFGVDDKRFGGIGPAEAFIQAYEAADGETIDRRRIDYWEVVGNARWAVGALNQARRHLRGVERNLEFASLGRRSAEMELEAIRLIRGR